MFTVYILIKLKNNTSLSIKKLISLRLPIFFMRKTYKYLSSFSKIIMLLTIQLILSQIVFSQASAIAKTNRLTVNLKNKTLKDVIKYVENNTPYLFSYDEQASANLSVADLTLTNATVELALQKIKQKLPISYAFNGNQIVLRINNPTVRAQQSGKISGDILDEKNQSLPGATIRIEELNKTSIADVEGHYNVSAPEGTYTLLVSFVSYQSKRITGVKVNANQTINLNVTLQPAVNQLEQVVITSTYQRETIQGLYARQKNSASTTDGITREQVLRTPDNNISQVLNRISGINIQGGKFAVVRGLSDRYNNVTLNGSLLPSTEPNQRNFAFDAVPSALIDNVTVYKTATPDLTGEFSGGLINVNTRDIPVQNFASVTLGTGFNSKATGETFYQPQRGKYDFLGHDDGNRQLPDNYDFNTYARLVGEGFRGSNVASRQQYNAISSQFPNRYKMFAYNGDPLQSYEVNFGRVKEFKNNSRFGGLASITYRNEQTAEEYEDFAPAQYSYFGRQYNFTTNLSGMLNLGYTFGKSKIALKNLYSRKLNERSNIYDGVELSTDNLNDGYASLPLINTILQNRIEGEHAIGDAGLKVNWHGAYANTLRNEPNNYRISGFKGVTDPYYFYINNPDPLVYRSNFFSDLKEYRLSWGTDVQKQFDFIKQKQLVKVGYLGNYRNAEFAGELFTSLLQNNNRINELNGQPYYNVFAPENFNEGGIVYIPFLSTNFGEGRSNGYEGFQRLNAFYAMLDGHLTEKLRVTGGFRLELNNTSNKSIQLRYNSDNSPVRVDSLISLKTTDWLPSVNLIYALTPKTNVRASYFKTVARPDLRELSFFQYYEPEKRTFVSGNRLEATNIQNVDLRYEFFPSSDEIFSISGFYKQFKNPIELQIVNSQANPNNVLNLSYVNLKSAVDYGLELNFRKSFAFINQSSAKLKNLFLSGNFTYIDAKVEYDADVFIRTADGGLITQSASRDRNLYGQAPYIINGSLLYQGKKFGINTSYSRTGERIIFGSNLDEFNEYEKARDVLDFQVYYRFLKKNNAEIKFNAVDLLNQPVIRYYNNSINITENSTRDANGNRIDPEDPSGKRFDSRYDLQRRRFRFGQNFNLSISYNF